MRKRILAVAIAAATMAGGAQAAGFYLKEQSVVGQGRAFAGSAAGTDGASAAYFNPAGIVGLERQVEVGVHVISPDAKVSDEGSLFGTTLASVAGANSNTVKPYDAKPVPNAQLVVPISQDMSFGLAVGAPFGFGNEYNANGFQRLDSIKNELAVIELTASLARAVSPSTNISVGIMYQDLELEQSKGSAPTFPTGLQVLKAESSDVGFVLGLQHKVSDKTTVGASYRSQVTHTPKGTITVSDSGPLNGVYAASAPFQLPDIAAFGIAHSISDSARAYADVTWYGWSAYSTQAIAGAPLPTTIQSNYNNTVSYSLGLEKDYSAGVTARAGIHFDPTPTNDTDRSTSTPDGDRTWLSVGASKLLAENLIVDGALTYILVEDGIVNRTTTTGPTPNGLTKAKASGNVGILSLGLRYKF